MSLQVLLVEDNPGDVRLTKEAFRDANMAISLHVASDGVEAMAFLRREEPHTEAARPDIILLDLNLPRMDGREVLALIKGDDDLKCIPTVILTTSEAEADIVKSYQLHANCYLSKPVKLEEFESLVKSINDFWLTKGKTAPTEIRDMIKEKDTAILLIEDNAGDARLLQEMLKGPYSADHAKMTHVKCMRDAERFLSGESVDIILLDLGLEDVQGVDGVRRVKAAAPHTPLVILTCLDNDLASEQALQVGAQDYLIKGQVETRKLGRALTYAIGRHAVEEALKDSELRFRQIAETIADVFFVIDPSSSQTFYVSPAYEKIWGRPCESLYTDPRSWADSIHPDDQEYVAAKFAEGMLTGFDYEYRIIRPDGEIRWVQARGFPIFDQKSGKPYRTAGIVSDITARKRTTDELLEKDRRLSDMMGNIQLVSVMLDRDAHIIYCNDYLLHLTGWRREEIMGKNWYAIFIAPPYDSIKKMYAELLLDSPPAWHHENAILTKSREHRLIRWNNSVLRGASGEVIGTASIGEDITEKSQAEARIQGLNREHAMLSGLNALIVRVRNRTELFAGACVTIVEKGGFLSAWIAEVNNISGKLNVVAACGANPLYFDELGARLNGKIPGDSGMVARALKRLGPVICNAAENSPGLLESGDDFDIESGALVALPLKVPDYFTGVLILHANSSELFDEAEKTLLEVLAGNIVFGLQHIQKLEKLDYLAYYDALTGLANRTLFIERLGQKLIAAADAKRRIAVFKLDIERFRTINEALGRQAGDDLLRQIADRLRKAGRVESAFAHVKGDRFADLRDGSLLGRLGADQFAIISTETQNEEQWARLTELRLANCFGPVFHIENNDVKVSAKMGIAVFPSDGADADSLLKSAAAAVKKAKAVGERYVFYSQEMTRRTAATLDLESKLRQALENQEFVLHYQPKVEIESRQIVGVEALVRWQSPELGLVSPLKFIPLMEETGMIVELGTWALAKAVTDHSRWSEMGLAAPPVAVNVSAIQIKKRGFFNTVTAALALGGTDQGLDLEITESLIMDDVEGNIQKLKEVRALGVGIAIDDFGTGYSSLGYLAKLPVETLKIDRSFIITMLDAADTMTLVQTMITMAHSLRLKVVAEGVESEEQAKILRLLRCDEMQGYLFSKPLPFDVLTAMLRDES